MKLATAPQDVTLSSDFEQRDVAIGDVAFILDMFADKVYSNKERAVIRELACNAHDSHVMAGTEDVQFDVHLPTMLEPWFSLRDYGTGLEDADIADVYGAIGVSTKRDSNEVIGCFGIGSLSPYSMCDSFTVKSYLNGIVRTYQCMRDEKRQPKVIPLGEAPTVQPNGLEVKLTVNDKVSEFTEEAKQVFLFWEGTMPNINSDEVTRSCEAMRDQYVFKSDDFGLTPSWGSMYALMGNIAYRIPVSMDEFNVDGYLKFNLGELEFDTARENLAVTDKNKAAIKAKFALVKNSLVEVAEKQISEADSVWRKAVIAESLSKGQLGRYIGRDTLKEYVLPDPKESVTYWQAKYRGSEKYNTKQITASVDVKYYLDKPRMQTRIRSYLKDMPSGYTMFIFKDLAQAKECGIPVGRLEDLDDLPKVDRVTRVGSTYSRCKTLLFKKSYHGWYDSECWSEHDLELDGSEIVYVEVNRSKPLGCCEFTNSNRQIRSTLSTADEDLGEISLIGLKTAFLKTAAFRKGNFIHLDDYLKREYAKKAPKTFFKYKDKDLTQVRTINSYIKCDAVVEIVDLAESCKNDQIAGICERLGIVVDMEEDTLLQELMDEFNDKFKMLSVLSDWDIRQNKTIVAEYISGIVKE
ncbi:MAG: hypothetical protein GY893_10130 [bacterium]|nr:hypothetical protein [bacterium]